MAERAAAIRISPLTATALALASVAGLAMFCWPLLIETGARPSSDVVAGPFVFLLVIPVLVAIVLAAFSENGMDAKALAILGVLSAVIAVLRPLGAGLAGIETVFFLLVLAGRVYGPGFGFVLGCTSLFASALLTAGVGPWLPYQMLASAWIGLGAGLLPSRPRGRAEIAMLVAYGVVVAYAFGLLMNLSFWPFSLGTDTSLSFVPGAPVAENLHRFVVFSGFTSAVWDTGRAVTNAVLLVALGPALLAMFRRSATKANFTGTATAADPAPDPQQASAGR